MSENKEPQLLMIFNMPQWRLFLYQTNYFDVGVFFIQRFFFLVQHFNWFWELFQQQQLPFYRLQVFYSKRILHSIVLKQKVCEIYLLFIWHRLFLLGFILFVLLSEIVHYVQFSAADICE